MSRLKTFISILVVAMLAIVPAACGGSGDADVSADADPQEVLNQTFGTEGAVTSANLNTEVTLSQEGSGGGENLDLKLSGPIQETEGDVPEVDLTLDLKGQMDGENIDFNAGLALIGDKGFVTIDGETYELDQALMGQLETQAAESQADVEGDSDGESGEDAGLFADLNPESFLTDLSNEGTVEIDGDETVHITGTIDTAAASAELEDVISGAGALQGLGVDIPGASDLRDLEESVGNIQFDIYTGADDSVLRRMEFALPYEEEGQSGSLDVSLGLADANEDQDIQEPHNAKPFMDLIGALSSGALEGLGIDDLSELGDLGSMGGSSGFGFGGSGSGQGSGGQSG